MYNIYSQCIIPRAKGTDALVSLVTQACRVDARARKAIAYCAWHLTRTYVASSLIFDR